MNYEKLIEALKLDLPKALENCPDCGGYVFVSIGLSKSAGKDRPFAYKIWRQCLECDFAEEM